MSIADTQITVTSATRDYAGKTYNLRHVVGPGGNALFFAFGKEPHYLNKDEVVQFDLEILPLPKEFQPVYHIVCGWRGLVSRGSGYEGTAMQYTDRLEDFITKERDSGFELTKDLIKFLVVGKDRMSEEDWLLTHGFYHKRANGIFKLLHQVETTRQHLPNFLTHCEDTLDLYKVIEKRLEAERAEKRRLEERQRAQELFANNPLFGMI